MHCLGGNATDPIWRVLASSDGISSWTPLKPQHSNPKPNPLANQLCCSDFLTPPHLSSSLTDSLPSLNLLCHSKADARFMQDASKAVWSVPYVSVAFFPSLKQNFIAYHSSKMSSRSDCIFEIHQRWPSGFSRVYSNCCCRCSFEAEIIKIGQSSHKRYSNNLLTFQESTTTLNASTKKTGNLSNTPRILKLNWMFWIRTVWVNWIALNRNMFDNQTMYSCYTELFEIELIICIKMDSALNNPQSLIWLKNQTTNQLIIFSHFIFHFPFRSLFLSSFCFHWNKCLAPCV